MTDNKSSKDSTSISKNQGQKATSKSSHAHPSIAHKQGRDDSSSKNKATNNVQGKSSNKKDDAYKNLDERASKDEYVRS